MLASKEPSLHWEKTELHLSQAGLSKFYVNRCITISQICHILSSMDEQFEQSTRIPFHFLPVQMQPSKLLMTLQSIIKPIQSISSVSSWCSCNIYLGRMKKDRNKAEQFMFCILYPRSRSGNLLVLQVPVVQWELLEGSSSEFLVANISIISQSFYSIIFATSATKKIREKSQFRY